MITNLTKEDLIAFEEDIAAEFNAGNIKAPVHLYSGNEDQMLDIFAEIKHEDAVFCTWRSHYQCLLKGVPKERLKADILAGKSISLNYPEYRIFSSAIVGGNIPIALGAAMALQIGAKPGKVWCFVGDMTAETGVFIECLKYANNFKLPIVFVIEDNNKSVCTDTRETLNVDTLFAEALGDSHITRYYKYESRYPHSGAGQRIQF